MLTDISNHISEDTYANVRSSLLDRLNDKEPGIRALVVAALARLVGTEDPDPDSSEKSILSTLLEVLETDPAASAFFFCFISNVVFLISSPPSVNPAAQPSYTHH